MKLQFSDPNIIMDGVRNKNGQEFVQFLSFLFHSFPPENTQWNCGKTH
jgi:hypothetical protein